MRTKRFMLSMLLGMLLGLNGCALFLVGAGAAAGAGTIAYTQGELKVGQTASLDRSWSATTQAMEDLQLKVISAQRDQLSGRVIARTADDQKVQIKLTKEMGDVTDIRIRVGPIGDEAKARMIYDKIKSHL